MRDYPRNKTDMGDLLSYPSSSLRVLYYYRLLLVTALALHPTRLNISSFCLRKGKKEIGSAGNY